jgi:hypothetical protein
MLTDHTDTHGQGIGRACKALILHIYEDPTGSGGHIPCHDVHQGGFPCTVFSEEGVYLSPAEIKIGIIQGMNPISRKIFLYTLQPYTRRLYLL